MEIGTIQVANAQNKPISKYSRLFISFYDFISYSQLDHPYVTFIINSQCPELCKSLEHIAANLHQVIVGQISEKQNKTQDMNSFLK